ncbi:hypothetical protein [Bosea caraganae]|uniref:hypothetical protein n=1 Tax=Bosea caraganae TaxID=2763117 RepID=UPI0011C06B9B|nr:hypothetical protein [Bosea caraganae]
MSRPRPNKTRPLPAMVASTRDAEKAAELIEALSGCLEGTAEEGALVDLIFKLEVWEAKKIWRGTALAQRR